MQTVKPNRITIVEALKHADLFGALPCFQDLSSWHRWIVLGRAAYGLPLTSDEETLFRLHTGRSKYLPIPGGFSEVVVIVGRQAGKDRFTTVVAAFEAITRLPQNDGTDLYVLIVAQDARGAQRTTFGYLKSLFTSIPLLAAEVESMTQDTIRLKNGVVIAVYPCRSQSIRGIRACVAILNEFGFFMSTENIPQDKNMLQAVRPTLATTGGRLFILSSPYDQSGALWELYRKHYGRDDSPVLVWQATAPQMNPTLPQDYLERMEADDPEAYKSEVLGEFRAGVSSFLDNAIISESIDTGIRERAPGHDHVAFADAASGTGKDQFTLGVAHLEGDMVILDCIRGWKPPFNPSGVIAEISDLLKRYGVSRINGDKYAPGFVEEHFRINNITYQYSDLDRSAIYMELLPMLNSGRVRLLDVPEMLRELRGLERRRGTSGRDRIDHRPGQHDDLANSSAGCLVLASRPSRVPGIFVF